MKAHEETKVVVMYAHHEADAVVDSGISMVFLLLEGIAALLQADWRSPAGSFPARKVWPM